jgi:hypothetical protein
MLIREATPDDNEGLLRLTSLVGMRGVIDLRIDRKPDFFALLKERGPCYILVAESDGQIVGIIASAVHEALVMGNLRTIHYISDFKVHPDHQNSTLAFRMVEKLVGYLKLIDADLLLCTSILGNKKVEPFFQGHLGIPRFTEMGTFSVFQILPSLFGGKDLHLLQGGSSKDELEELSDFFNMESQDFAMAPHTKPQDLKNKMNLLKRENGKIIAAVCIADYMHLKQNVVTKVPFNLKLISKGVNLLSHLIPSFHLPEEGEAIRLLNIKRMAVSSGKISDLHKLISSARYMLYKNQFIFLTIALHPADPCRKVFTRLPKFTLFSKVWMSSLKGDQDLLNTLQKGVLFEDYSLV